MSEDAIRQQPGLEGLDDATLAVRALISASQDLTVRTARTMGMNVTDMRALLLLSEHGPLGATDLAAHLGITLASTTVLVCRLEDAGHVTRVRDVGDRRRVTITDTAAARTATTTAWLPSIQDIDDVCQTLTSAERTFTVDLLTRLSSAMRRTGRG